MRDLERFDLVVIGAGFHGLCTARTYLQINPEISLIILDSARSIGGVWAEERLYPGLSTNNVLGHYQFADFPMEDPRLAQGSHIPGESVHDYLSSYARRFDLIKRIRLCNQVHHAEELDSGWLLHTESVQDNRWPRTSNNKKIQILASKLIVAAGLTSDPIMPDFPGADAFGSPILHTKNFAADASIRSHRSGSVVIYGGAKSAYDAVYAYALRGVQVHWVIRPNGRGPCWMAPTYVTPFKLLAENLITTRLLTWLSPCIWGDADGYAWIRQLLHGSRLGRQIVQLFNFGLALDVATANAYRNHPETAKLYPWYNLFWIGTGRGILNYDTDIFEYIRSGQVKVHIRDIDHLSSGKVHLSDSNILKADALVCCTGWKHAPPILFTKAGRDISSQLGIPSATELTHDERKLINSVDEEILKQFPSLKNTPLLPKVKPLSSADGDTLIHRPYSLYRFMVPTKYLQTRNIAFAGCIRSPFTPVVAQIQSLWIAAFFAGKVDHLKLEQLGNGSMLWEKIVRETVLHARFGVYRYPLGFGDLYPDIFFDSLPYADLLLADLGLRRWRKRSWWRECLEHYGPDDYRHLVDEWLGETV